MFSKACEYGIRATIFIAKQSLQNRKVSLKEVAKAVESPEAFTSKILQKLSKEGVVNSVKGPNGGFSMDVLQLGAVRISTVVLTIDGDSIFKHCALGLTQCSEIKPCPLHNQFKLIRGQLKKVLETTLVKDLAIKMEKGLTYLMQ